MPRHLRLLLLSSSLPFLCNVASSPAWADPGAATAPNGAQAVDVGSDGEEESFIEELTYKQAAGLPPAASKIFYSDRSWAVSGFGEVSQVIPMGSPNRSSEDIELYYSNLYRFVTYAGWRPVDWLVLYAEIFAELYHDGLREVQGEAFFEVFTELMLSPHLNIRLGTFQIPIGYMNTNDEPIKYFSVNRAEVERLIVPSTWIDLGVAAHGNIAGGFSYMGVLFQGADGGRMRGGSWIRGGREARLDLRTWGVAGELAYKGIEGLEIVVNGLHMESGNNRRVDQDGVDVRVSAPTTLLSSYVRLEYENWTLMGLGAMGWLGETDLLYELTGARGGGGPQILGARTFGFYVELAVDILPWLRGEQVGEPSRGFFHRSDEFKLPIFLRYERLDTHQHVDKAMQARIDDGEAVFRSDLDIFTVGANFNLRKNLVVKTNFQYRRNRASDAYIPPEAHRLEVGVGFIF